MSIWRGSSPSFQLSFCFNYLFCSYRNFILQAQDSAYFDFYSKPTVTFLSCSLIFIMISSLLTVLNSHEAPIYNLLFQFIFFNLIFPQKDDLFQSKHPAFYFYLPAITYDLFSPVGFNGRDCLSTSPSCSVLLLSLPFFLALLTILNLILLASGWSGVSAPFLNFLTSSRFSTIISLESGCPVLMESSIARRSLSSCGLSSRVLAFSYYSLRMLSNLSLIGRGWLICSFLGQLVRMRGRIYIMILRLFERFHLTCDLITRHYINKPIVFFELHLIMFRTFNVFSQSI